MGLPPEPVLIAALRWLEVLPGSGGIARAQSLLNTHPRYSDLTPTQYATALGWLREVELTAPADRALPPALRLIAAVFERAAPPWVKDSDVLVRGPEELPSDVLSCGEALGLEPETIYGQLVASWGKVDTAARAVVGAAGEVALVELLGKVPHADVEHVALWSDGFGYDVEYRHSTGVNHLEVKSSTRRGRFTAYLSRHEYEVMSRDNSWQLVVVRLTERHELVGVGSVPKDWISANAPLDSGTCGRWATMQLDIPSHVILSGVPALGEAAKAVLPPWV